MRNGSSRERHPLYRALVIYYAPLLFPVVFLLDFLKTIAYSFVPIQKVNYVNYEKFIPIFQLIVIIFLNNSFFTALYLFLVMHAVTSFIIVGTSFSVHHDNLCWHDGDEPLKDRDFGRHILATTRDHSVGNLVWNFLLFAGLNDHVLHHLFPTIDHSRFDEIRPEFKSLCAKFGITYNEQKFFDLQWGVFTKLLQVGTVFKENVYS